MIVFNGTRDEAVDLIRSLPAILAGVVPDPFGLADRVKLRAGVALLSEVQQDFIVKSRGGTGRDGVKWPDLKPETVANRRVTRAEKKAAGVTGRRVRGLLTPAQDREWRKRFRVVYLAARRDVGHDEARRIAFASAWKWVKEHFGAVTRKEVFGGRKVDILRDTGELFRSLTPGVEYTPSGEPGQVFDTSRPGRVIVGTNKKPQHQTGDPARGLPARHLWPADGKIPDAWWPGVNDAIRTGTGEVIAAILRGVVP